MMTQELKIIEYMRKKGGITQREAVKLGCFRLSARIYDLRKMGYGIKSETVAVKTQSGGYAYVARYSLEERKDDKRKGN